MAGNFPFLFEDSDLSGLAVINPGGGLPWNNNGFLCVGDAEFPVIDEAAVIAALGYTPVNKAGDIMSGDLSVLKAGVASVGAQNSTSSKYIAISANATDTFIQASPGTLKFASNGNLSTLLDIATGNVTVDTVADGPEVRLNVGGVAKGLLRGGTYPILDMIHTDNFTFRTSLQQIVLGGSYFYLRGNSGVQIKLADGVTNGSLTAGAAEFSAVPSFPGGFIKFRAADGLGIFAGNSTAQTAITFGYYATGQELGAIVVDNGGNFRIMSSGGGYMVPTAGVNLFSPSSINASYSDMGFWSRNYAGSAWAAIQAGASTFHGQLDAIAGLSVSHTTQHANIGINAPLGFQAGHNYSHAGVLKWQQIAEGNSFDLWNQITPGYAMRVNGLTNAVSFIGTVTTASGLVAAGATLSGPLVSNQFGVHGASAINIASQNLIIGWDTTYSFINSYGSPLRINTFNNQAVDFGSGLATFAGSIASNAAISAQGTGWGSIALHAGDIAGTGFIAWRNPAGTRQGYMGYDYSNGITLNMEQGDFNVVGEQRITKAQDSATTLNVTNTHAGTAASAGITLQAEVGYLNLWRGSNAYSAGNRAFFQTDLAHAFFIGGVEVGEFSTAGLSVVGRINLTEMVAPAAPAANNAVLYLEDNGAGKTKLMVRFATGAAQQITIEP